MTPAQRMVRSWREILRLLETLKSWLWDTLSDAASYGVVCSRLCEVLVGLLVDSMRVDDIRVESRRRGAAQMVWPQKR